MSVPFPHSLGWPLEVPVRVPGEGLILARIVSLQRGRYALATAEGERFAHMPSRIAHEAETEADFPVVGDWVTVRPMPEGLPWVLVEVLPRRSRLSRKMPGRETREQVLVANVDVAFVLMSLTENYNRNRLERYILMALAGGVEPVVVLTKADLVDDAKAMVKETRDSAAGAPVLAVSAVEGTGMAALRKYLMPQRTIALVGSSGVGKSTLLNTLVGEEVMDTAEVRDSDGEGRHTTSFRELFVLPGGALAIDNPGMRELSPWVGGIDLAVAFPDIAELAARCRFANCNHDGERDCAIAEALEAETLDPIRYENYCKLRAEQEELFRLLREQTGRRQAGHGGHRTRRDLPKRKK